jgi:D-alanyl-D-alanine carboxypeptidase
MIKRILNTAMIAFALVLTGCSLDDLLNQEQNSTSEENQHSSGSDETNQNKEDKTDNKKHTNDYEEEKQEESDENDSEAAESNEQDYDEAQQEQTNRPSLEDTVTVDADGKKVVTNVDDTLVLVNKERNLPADYVPADLVVPDIPFSFTEDLPKKKLRKITADAVEALFEKAKKDRIQLYGVSGYRSYDHQDAIFAYNAEQRGKEEANKVSAFPGQSEHQTGLAFDVSSRSVNYGLIEEFGNTKEGKWLKENAADFGFIIRYLEGKEDITGYQYEPWHIRYVGVDAAKEITQEGLTLEEYLENE